MNRFARVTRNVAILFAGNLVNKAAGAVLFIILARHVGASGLGKYAFAVAFTALFAALPDLGLNTMLVRTVARDRSSASKYLGNVAVLRALLAVLAFCLTGIGLSVGVWTGRIQPDTAPIVWLVAGAVFFASIGNGVRWSFQAFERLEYEAVLSGGESLLMLAGGVLVLVSGYGLVELTAVQFGLAALACAAGLLLTTTRIARPAFELDRAFCKQLIIAAVPFILMFILTRVYFNFDMVLLSFLRGDAETGRYGAAYRFITMLQMIPMLCNFAVFPVMVEAAAGPKEEFLRVIERSFRYMTIVGLGIGVTTTVFAAPIIQLLYGMKFVEAAPVLRLLIWMSCCYFVTNVSYCVVIACHRERAVVTIGGIVLGTNVVCNLFLIPRWGAIGAACAILVSESLSCGLFLRQVARSVEAIRWGRLFLRPACAAAATAIPAWLLRETHLVVGLGGVAVAYLVLLLLFGAIPKGDLRLARAFVREE